MTQNLERMFSKTVTSTNRSWHCLRAGDAIVKETDPGLLWNTNGVGDKQYTQSIGDVSWSGDKRGTRVQV